MSLLALVGAPATHAGAVAAAAAASTGIEINLFWVIVAAGNFVVFFAVAWIIFFKPVTSRLEERRARIERGLQDADAARREREETALDRNRVIGEARHEANEILQRAQKAADDAREREVAAVHSEIDRMRAQAEQDIEAERQRALADVRSQIADLALSAAGRVVRETMTSERERRLVEQFLAETSGSAGASRGAPN